MFQRRRSENRTVLESLKARVDELTQQLAQIEADASMKGQILSSMSEGLIVMKGDGTPIYVNASAEGLLGNPPQLPPNILEDAVVEFSVRSPHKRDLNAVASRLADLGWLVVIRDVTETRRVESVRSDFVANVSHELKTPVAGILASAETLELSAKEDPQSVDKFATSLMKEARKLSRIIDDLLDLARLEQEAPPFEQVDLSGIVEGEVARVEDFASRKSLNLESRVEPAIKVLGNPEDLALAVRNLLVNAVRYTEQGSVSVTLEASDESAVFSVTDTGFGIPEKDLNRIFERFYRVDKARARQTGGTGLGLSIVGHVVERHGGDVRAESELGNGSTFTMTLPV